MAKNLSQRIQALIQNSGGKSLLSFVALGVWLCGSGLPAKAQLFNRPPASVQNQGYGQGGGDQGGADPASLLLRVDRLENQMRAMNGQIEELQFQLRQSQEQLRKFQGDVEFRFQDLGKGGAGGGVSGGAVRPPQKRTDAGDGLPAAQQSATLAGGGVAPNALQPNSIAPNSGQQNGRASDAFDPSVVPTAPGAPQPLGSPRSASQPLDLMGGAGGGANSGNQPPPNVIPGSGGVSSTVPNAAVASLGGASSPREQFTSALNAYNLGQYDVAENGFRNVIAGSPADRLVPDAYFYLGETYFQRNQARAAAENFLKVTTDYPKSLHAPEAMLRLGLSLASLGARDQACATLGSLPSKFPSSPPAVRQAAVREHQRLKC